MSETTTKTAPTKEERIAKIDEQIAKLQQRKIDINNGTERKAKVETPLPKIGDVVKFKHGRKTATTAPRSIEGTVLGVKQAGEKTPALIKVQFGDGFDADTATIYPAQIESILIAA